MRRLLSVLLLLSTLAWVVEAFPARPDGLGEATVVYVDDGDTIDVQIGGRIERVRYIGIDAPEVPHHGQGGTQGGEVAAQVNRAMVDRRRVRLEADVEPRDRYGRLLAYVWLGDTMVNLEMVRRGYARALTIAPNLRYARWFIGAEAEARAAGRGLWGSGHLEGALLPPEKPVVVSSRAAVRRRTLMIRADGVRSEAGAGSRLRAITDGLIPRAALMARPMTRPARARRAHVTLPPPTRRPAHHTRAARRRWTFASTARHHRVDVRVTRQGWRVG
jgi:micrococcal nuclease